MSYQIINISQKEEWVACINNCFTYDFYHTWQYHSIDPYGEAMLFVYSEDDVFVAFPLIKRGIPNTSYYDFTSVYGYVGPISNVKFNTLSESFLTNLKKSLLGYMKQENIICLFSRLHPLIDQSTVIDKFGGKVVNGKTVFIPLDKTIESQRLGYRNNHLRDINALRGKNILFKEALTDNEIEEFVIIYTENMKRLNATDEYFFDHQYFKQLAHSSEFTGQILLLYLDNIPIAGCVFTYTNYIIQVHLIATKTDYLQHSPTKTLIDEVSCIGRDRGMKYLHLGGGVGGKNDSLFYWKAGFSPSYLIFETWRIINDLVAYNQLAYEHSESGNITDTKSDYFPLYRKSIA
jgi:hypothetical protein